ncbi:MAG: ferredoxin:protochlorophyllide reductase (ATP-dependent) subunit B [Alphaproteobacteria bacterium]|nr:ferredoxin:protochlorophyllide reductase (ATP-dependent) subunit B [Alphaproteobacteria bacterium]
MKLTVWTYEGPPHVGAMRIATALKDVHYVLHAPQGDTYADLLFTMIERRKTRPPVTYTTFQARDLGSDTAEIFKTAAREAYDRFQPQALLVGASCTAELIQDDPGGLTDAIGLPVPVVPLELPSYQRKENWGASETFYHLVRKLTKDLPKPEKKAGAQPTCNLLGPTALGFRHRDDLKEISKLLDLLNVKVNVVAPFDATVADLRRIPEADFNVMLYPEIAETTVRWLERQFGQPYTKTVPIGVGATRDFIGEIADLTGVDPEPLLADLPSNMPWWTRSIDSTYLTNKRVFIFGDASHAAAAARVAHEEMGFEVVGLGTYSREFARSIREAAEKYDVEPLITDDYLEVEAKIQELQPEMILGTQMERHIAKRFGIGCAVISAPVHVQDFPARYSPQMGFEGTNVLFDTWIHPLMMGLEEHLIGMFREDFEFSDDAAPSHLGHSAARPEPANRDVPQPHQSQTDVPGVPRDAAAGVAVLERPTTEAPAHETASPGTAPDTEGAPVWTVEAEKELKKIPFFVRGKARRNTEAYAAERQIGPITVETLYDAKAHFGK